MTMYPVAAWRCDVCGKRIYMGRGYITIADRNGGYPQGMGDNDDEPQRDNDDEPQRAWKIVKLDLSASLPEPSIRFSVLHAKCDTRPDSGEYWFAVERARTLEDWVAWAIHLSGKTWFGKRDMRRFLRLWWSNRGFEEVWP